MRATWNAFRMQICKSGEGGGRFPRKHRVDVVDNYRSTLQRDSNRRVHNRALSANRAFELVELIPEIAARNRVYANAKSRRAQPIRLAAIARPIRSTLITTFAPNLATLDYRRRILPAVRQSSNHRSETKRTENKKFT